MNMKKKSAILIEDAIKKQRVAEGVEDVEWGENHEERMVDHSERHGSLRHICKGRGCGDRFEKL